MAIYPDARVRLIPPGSNDPAITVIGAILHVDAGNSPSLYGYFNGRSGGVESHFHVPKQYKTEQYRDTRFEADANYRANSFEIRGKRFGYLSIETQGYAAGRWDSKQLNDIKDLLVWASQTHDFPLRRCPAHMSPGVGYHIMFGAPGPWTPVAKECPGRDRIRQFDVELEPWMRGYTGRDVTIAAQAVLWAAAGSRPGLSPGEPLLTDSYLFDAQQFMAFAYAGLKVIPEYTFRAWRDLVDDPTSRFGNYGCGLMQYTIWCVRTKAGLYRPGTFDADVARYVERFDYNVI